jgi:branched-chain amino acid transport system substrate-binding protein
MQFCAPPHSRFPFLHFFLFSILAFGVFYLLTGCADKNEPIKLGFAGELSGDNRSPSIKLFQGVQLAVEKRNAAGGVHGRQVELISRDDGGRPDRAPAVDRELAAADVEAIIGHPTSSTSLAAMEFINSSEIVMLSPTATADALFSREDNFFTFLAPNSRLAAHIAEFGREELGIKTVAALYDEANSGYTKNYYRNFHRAFTKAGGQLLDVRSFDSTTTTAYGALVEELLATSPDAFLIIASSTETASFLQQMYKRSADLPVLACDWSSTQDLIQLGGPYSRNVYMAETLHFNRAEQVYRPFAEAFRERFGEEPSIGAAKGYEAARVVLQALEKRKEGTELKEVLLQETFEGLRGELDFNRYGDLQRRLCIKTVREQHFEMVQ